MDKMIIDDGGKILSPWELEARNHRKRLREEYAKAAMQSLIPIYWDTLDSYESADEMTKCLMESSVEYADALIMELEKQDELRRY